ncbi:MAG: S8 family serine peptidase, partial [Bacteroidota bacterium]
MLSALEAVGMKKGAYFQHVVSGRMPISRLNELEKVAGLRYAFPELRPRTHTGSVTSEGVQAMRADLARNNFGVDGRGIKIGVLSDSYNTLGGANTGIASGDLPGPGNPNGFTTPIEVIRDDLDPDNIDEGRAMFEIIHDVAPGAELAFHTAFGGAAVFAEGIILLADAGCDIIVDDVGYLTQPFFQDGIVAKAVDQVKARGVAFFSAAGNSADASYESAYTAQASTALNSTLGENYLDYHDFGGGDIRQSMSIDNGVTLQVTLQWDDPFASAVSVGGAPGADTDLDFILLDNSDNVLASSVNINTLSGDPVEFIQYTNTSGATQNLNFVIARFSGPNPVLIKYIDFTGITINEFATNSSTSFAHPNAAGAMGVGAAFWFQTPAFGTSPPLVEPFSSLGGTPIIFDTLGNRLGSFEDRAKPDVVGPDGGNNTFFGQQISDGDSNPNFFGTSAAAPHVAALAGLMLEASGGKRTMDPDTLYNILESTAIEMGAAGFDNLTGFGLVDGNAAVSEAQNRDVSAQSLLINEVDASQTDTDAGEFVELYDGGSGNTSLDGFVLVFYDGSDDASYLAIDLDGASTDANGYYVVGNSGVPNVGLTFANNTLQNGADAVALYRGNGSDFVSDTPLRFTNLIDAVVYDTDDDDDNELLRLLKDGESQVNENENSDQNNESLQRLPNGSGGQRNSSTYAAALSTPGAENSSTPTNCSISNITAGSPSACNASDNRYTVDITVSYSNAPASGDLVVNGQSFAITSSPQTVTLSNLSSNGLTVDVTANFSIEPSCSLRVATLFTAPSSCFNAPEVFINEIDADIADTEDEEFIELYDGGSGNTSLDNLVIVLYNGNDDQSYTPVFDLDGLQTDAEGYFLIGGSNLSGIDDRVTANTGIRFDSNGWLQNGADAVVLYVGDAEQFPNDSPISTNNIVDAIVYETG